MPVPDQVTRLHRARQATDNGYHHDGHDATGREHEAGPCGRCCAGRRPALLTGDVKGALKAKDELTV